MGIQRSSDVHARIHIMSLGYSDKFFFWFVSFIIFDEHRSVLWKMLLHGSYLMLIFFLFQSGIFVANINSADQSLKLG